jgi:hypothetical protein
MSTACRQFRTTIMLGSYKLLIVQGCATVAEGRQGGQEVTSPDNNYKRVKLKAVSLEGSSMTRFVARKGSHAECLSLWPLVVLLRHYIVVLASLIIRHCERVNGKAPAMQRNLP